MQLAYSFRLLRGGVFWSSSVFAHHHCPPLLFDILKNNSEVEKVSSRVFDISRLFTIGHELTEVKLFLTEQSSNAYHYL